MKTSGQSHWCVLAGCCGIWAALVWHGAGAAQEARLPTADEVKILQAKYQAEHDRAVKDGVAKRFAPILMEKAEELAKKGLTKAEGDNADLFLAYQDSLGQEKQFTTYNTGELELYDLTTDPYQLINQAANVSYASTVAELKARVQELCSPAPPGFQFSYDACVAKFRAENPCAR